MEYTHRSALYNSGNSEKCIFTKKYRFLGQVKSIRGAQLLSTIGSTFVYFFDYGDLNNNSTGTRKRIGFLMIASNEFIYLVD
jgi:hypothetical protein